MKSSLNSVRATARKRGVDHVSAHKHDGRDGEDHQRALMPAGQRGDAAGRGGCRGFFRGEEWQERENGDDRNVLEQEHGKRGLAGGGLELAPLLEGLQDDRSRGHGEDQPGGNRHARVDAERDADRGNHPGGAEHLQPAESDEFTAHFPEPGRLQLQSDKKEHHHDAELGEVHHVVGVFADEAERVRTDQHAGEQVAQHGTESETFGERYGDHRGGEVDKGVGKDGIHRRTGARLGANRYREVPAVQAVSPLG